MDIPRDSFVVVTGLSGSGKSSLAFDTVYAEGQRRYMDTLSTYAKHFMGVLEKPEVESIEGLSPIIAMEQKTTGKNPRSTVGTITEIFDFLRLLYARASRAYSPVTGKEMVRYTDAQIVDLIIEGYKGRKCYLLAPLVRGRKGHYRELFDQLRRRGYTEVRIDGEIRPLNEVDALDRYKGHFIELVVDKLKPSEGDQKRIRDSVMTALNLGKGSVAMLEAGGDTLEHFSKHLVDPDSGMSLQEPAPHSFSFNSPEGYCPHCKGLGMIVDVNIDTIIPDRSVSIADGGIIPLGRIRETKKFDVIRSIARKYGFSLFDPIASVPDEAISHIIFGSDELFRIGEGNLSEMVSFGGIVDDIDDKVECPVCHGTRLNENTKCFKIDGKTISDVAAMEMTQLEEWFTSLPSKLNERENNIARDILNPCHRIIRQRTQLRAVELVLEDRHQGLVDQGRLPAAAYSRHTDETSEREIHVDILEIVPSGSPYSQGKAVAPATHGRDRDGFPALEIIQCQGFPEYAVRDLPRPHIVLQEIFQRGAQAYPATFFPGTRTDIHQPVSIHHRLQVVLHHHHGIAFIPQFLQ